MEDAPSRPLSPIEYANYLESLSNDDFWKHAQALAAHSARPMQDNIPSLTPSTPTITCLTCFIRDGGSCILPFTVIRAILPTSQHITRLPDVPPWVIGILSWRGETMAAIDLCAYISRREPLLTQERITLIAKHENIWLALCVLDIDETPVEVDLEQVEALPSPAPTTSEDVVTLRSIAGTWQGKDTKSVMPLVLDVPELFKDIMQRIESRDTHV